MHTYRHNNACAYAILCIKTFILSKKFKFYISVHDFFIITKLRTNIKYIF